MGICNTFANIPGMVVPSIIEAMTPDVSKISLDMVRLALMYLNQHFKESCGFNKAGICMHY